MQFIYEIMTRNQRYAIKICNHNATHICNRYMQHMYAIKYTLYRHETNNAIQIRNQYIQKRHPIIHSRSIHAIHIYNKDAQHIYAMKICTHTYAIHIYKQSYAIKTCSQRYTIN